MEVDTPLDTVYEDLSSTEVKQETVERATKGRLAMVRCPQCECEFDWYEPFAQILCMECHQSFEESDMAWIESGNCGVCKACGKELDKSDVAQKA